MKIEEKKRTLKLSDQLLHFMAYGDWHNVGTYYESQLTDEQTIFMLDQLYNKDARFREWVNGKIEEGHILVKRKRSDPAISADNNKSRFTPDKDFEIVCQVQRKFSPPTSAIVNEVLDEFKESGITQRHVADKMGVVESRISSWKNDHSPIPSDRLHQLLNLRDKLCR